MRAPAFDGSHQGPPVGNLTYTVDDDHWWWSDGMYEAWKDATGTWNN
jgi:hypothetical protein